MIDLNTLISNALIAAVQQAVAPLNERIATLESACATQHEAMVAMRDRIAALEDQAIVTSNRINDRITALETKLTEANLFTQMTPATITADAFVTHLDQQEWFWHKIAGFVTNNSEITANDLEVLKDRVAALEDRVNDLESETQGENRYLNRDDVAALIEEAMDDHTSTYDHDDYDSAVSKLDDMPDLDDFVTRDSVREEIEDVLNNATLSLSI